MIKNGFLERLYLFSLLFFLVCIPYIGEAASIKTTLDAKYIRTDTVKTDEKTLINEYNPRLILQYSHPLTQWTDLSAEGIFNYKKEDKRPQEDTETREPQIELRLKSLIYDLKTGFKEVWNRNQTENRAFGHLLIQPLILPEFRLNYDHDEKENQYKKDKITIRTAYRPTKSFGIKFDLKHEYINNESTPEKTPESDIESLNLSGEIKFDHTLSSRRPVKVEASYKLESLYKEKKDDTEPVDQDELLQTLRGKLSYKPTNKTDISLEYENKTKDDHKGANDNTDQDLQLNLSQKMMDWLIASGRIRKESKEERREQITAESEIIIRDTEKLAFQGQLRAIPTDWFQLTIKAIDEQIDQTDPNNIPEKKEKTIFEGALRSDFPNLLRSYQTLDFKRVHENKEESPYSEEERFTWRWSLKPMDHLTLKPEFSRSITKNIKENKRDITKEYELAVDYDLNLNDYLSLSLSHQTSRKRIESRAPTQIRREINNDSALEVEVQPYESLFITSQITRKDYRIRGEKETSTSEEMSYSLRFDWAFNPFTWSTSYKYNDKIQQSDTETFESKLIYDISDYTLEGEYKFTQTFKVQKDKEDIITLRFKAVF